MAIAIGLWAINASVSISGKSLPLYPPGNFNRRGLISGVARVINQFQSCDRLVLLYPSTDSRHMASFGKYL
jgi:hypothetical protein